MNFKRVKFCVEEILQSRRKKTKYILLDILDEIREIKESVVSLDAEFRTTNWLLLDKDDEAKKESRKKNDCNKKNSNNNAA